MHISPQAQEYWEYRFSSLEQLILSFRILSHCTNPGIVLMVPLAAFLGSRGLCSVFLGNPGNDNRGRGSGLTRTINVSGTTHSERWFESRVCPCHGFGSKGRGLTTGVRGRRGICPWALIHRGATNVPLGEPVISISTEFLSTDLLYFEYVNMLSFCFVFSYLWAISRVAG